MPSPDNPLNFLVGRYERGLHFQKVSCAFLRLLVNLAAHLVLRPQYGLLVGTEPLFVTHGGGFKQISWNSWWLQEGHVEVNDPRFFDCLFAQR